MGDRTLRERAPIPIAFKTNPCSSLDVGEDVLSVYVTGNDTASDDKERQKNWQKTRSGELYPGVLSEIDHDKQIVNVDFHDGDKTVGVPFNLVKRQDGQFCDEGIGLQKRSPSTKHRQTTSSKAGYKWCHSVVHWMRFEEPKLYPCSFKRVWICDGFQFIINR